MVDDEGTIEALRGWQESATWNGADAWEVGRAPPGAAGIAVRAGTVGLDLQFHTSPLEEVHDFVVEVTDGQVVSGPAVEED